VQNEVKIHLEAIRKEKIPSSVFELHFILIGLISENVALVNRLHSTSASLRNWVDQEFRNDFVRGLESSQGFEFIEQAGEQTLQEGNSYTEDSACFPLPPRPKSRVTEATTAIFGGILPSRTVANGDLDQLAVIASDAEDLTEADEEDEEDPKVKGLDAYMLPPTRPGSVRAASAWAASDASISISISIASAVLASASSS
jgi:hypothetical protein